MQNFNLSEFLMLMVALVLGITVHEFSHAITADRLGDDTPRSQGRVTLSPLAHLDPTGTLFMAVSAAIGFGIGWGRPVLTNPGNYRIDRRIADSLVSFAGPLSNLVLAALFAVVVRAGIFPPTDAYAVLVERIVLVNILLFFFNLIPLYPLDGSHLLANALPPGMREGYYRMMAQFGFLLFLGLALSGVLGRLIIPPARSVFLFLVGAGA
jgi:Zn-dependent protease